MSPQRRATWQNGERGYSTRRHMLELVRPEAVLPDRALCLTTFSHFWLSINLLSHSLTLSLSLVSLSRSLSLFPLSLRHTTQHSNTHCHTCTLSHVRVCTRGRVDSGGKRAPETTSRYLQVCKRPLSPTCSLSRPGCAQSPVLIKPLPRLPV